jgi:hypothetical protein
MAKKESKEESKIVKAGDKCPHCDSTLIVALVCKDDDCGTVVHPADGYTIQPGSRHVAGVRYADRVMFNGFLSELTDSMVEFLNLQPKSRDGHIILQYCDETEIEILAHLVDNPQDAAFLESITKALEEGDGTLELALSG